MVDSLCQSKFYYLTLKFIKSLGFSVILIQIFIFIFQNFSNFRVFQPKLLSSRLSGHYFVLKLKTGPSNETTNLTKVQSFHQLLTFSMY